MLPLLFASFGALSHCLVLTRSDQSAARVITAMAHRGMALRLSDGVLFLPPFASKCLVFSITPSSVRHVAAALIEGVGTNVLHAG